MDLVVRQTFWKNSARSFNRTGRRHLIVSLEYKVVMSKLILSVFGRFSVGVCVQCVCANLWKCHHSLYSHIVVCTYKDKNGARTNGQIVLKSTLDIMVARGLSSFHRQAPLQSDPIYVYLLLKKEVKKQNRFASSE